MNPPNGGVTSAPLALGLGAAVLLGLGFVLQQRMARLLPVGDTLTPRLFADLIREPLWLAGILAMVAGQVLGALALGAGDVTLIEPLLTTNLLFALLIGRWISGQPFGAREWCGTLALIAGVVIFLVCAAPAPAPHPHHTTTDTATDTATATGTGLANVACLAAVVTVVATLVMIGRRRVDAGRAITLAAGAGLLFGLQDGLTRGVMTSLRIGIAELLGSWATYALVVVAVIGIWLMQSAFQAAPLRMSLPVVTAVEPLTGIGYGLGVYGERVSLSTGALTGQVLGLTTMVIGVVLVTRSHALTRHHTP